MKSEAKTLPPPPFGYRVMQAVMAPALNLLGLNCRQAFRLASEEMDRELTNSEALRLRVHFSMCGLCRRLPEQFRTLRAVIQACEHHHEHDEASDVAMTPEAKQRIAESLKSQQRS